MLADQRPFCLLMVTSWGMPSGRVRGDPDAAQVGEADAPVVVVLDTGYSGGSEEGAGAGAVLLVKDGLVGPDVGVAPPGMGIAVVAAGALGDELADLGDEGECWIYLLGGVEFLLQLVWGEPEAGVAAALVVGDQAVVDEAGNADAAIGVA